MDGGNPALFGWFAQVFELTWTFAGIVPVMIAVVLGAGAMPAPVPGRVPSPQQHGSEQGPGHWIWSAGRRPRPV
ncbi:hypothetical protein RGQ21_03120 [Kitasatospora aureofaciens]|nr:hypothetical protein RGQ21_03120 [Kitasatospora aureofaciens]